MTTETSEEKTFDYSKYQISTSAEEKILTIEETQETFTLRIRPMSWSRRNQLMSKHMNWQGDEKTGFDGDGFVRAYLRDIIVEAPWGRTTESFLLSIDARLGAALETLVPNTQRAVGEASEEIKKDV